MPSSNTENGNPPMRVAITIPANTGTGDTLRNLARAAGVDVGGDASIRVHHIAPGVDPTALRAAFVAANPRRGASIVASDFTTHGQAIESGEPFYEASSRNLDSYVRSADASTVAALLVICE